MRESRQPEGGLGVFRPAGEFHPNNLTICGKFLKQPEGPPGSLQRGPRDTGAIRRKPNDRFVSVGSSTTKRQKLDNMKTFMNPNYLSGLVQADGSFFVSFEKRPSSKNGLRFRPKFCLTLHMGPPGIS